jgi:hypothetical protein
VGADDVAAALGEAGIAVPDGAAGLLADPGAVLADRTVTGGWSRLPELLGASGRELARRRRAASALRAAAEAAELGLPAEARGRAGARGGSA